MNFNIPDGMKLRPLKREDEEKQVFEWKVQPFPDDVKLEPCERDLLGMTEFDRMIEEMIRKHTKAMDDRIVDAMADGAERATGLTVDRERLSLIFQKATKIYEYAYLKGYREAVREMEGAV